MDDIGPVSRAELERRRRERLFDLIRQQDQALPNTEPAAPPDISPRFARSFQEAAAKSLGQRTADRLLAINLRRR